MNEINNNLVVENSESSDGSSIRFINRKSGSRKQLCFSSDSSDCNSKNIATSTLIGRKRSCNPDNWAQKHKRTKGLAYRNRGGNLIPAKTFVDSKYANVVRSAIKKLFWMREATMKAFYSLHSQLEQNIFLRDCIKVKEIKRRRPTNNTKDSEFNAINISKFVAGGPQSLKNVDQPLLYPKGRTVTREKRRDMMDLLKFIPPVKHDYYKNLRINQNDETSHTADEWLGRWPSVPESMGSIPTITMDVCSRSESALSCRSRSN